MLIGSPEIYSAAIQPVEQARHSIRTIICAKGRAAPLAFSEAVARRLKDTKASGNPVFFDVIFAINSKQLPKDFINGVEQRYKIFEKIGVQEQVHLNVLDCDPIIGFDVLIIDDDHAFLSFPTSHAQPDVQTGIYFERPQSVSKELASWFVDRVKPHAIDYWIWSKS